MTNDPIVLAFGALKPVIPGRENLKFGKKLKENLLSRKCDF
jgi:hypothetical protein